MKKLVIIGLIALIAAGVYVKRDTVMAWGKSKMGLAASNNWCSASTKISLPMFGGGATQSVTWDVKGIVDFEGGKYCKMEGKIAIKSSENPMGNGVIIVYYNDKQDDIWYGTRVDGKEELMPLSRMQQQFLGKAGAFVKNSGK